MAVMDEDNGSARAPAPAPRRQPSYSCSGETTHDHKLSHSDSFWTPAESLRSSSASSSSPPLSSSSSCESIPALDIDRHSSLSSTSSYESLHHVEAAADHDHSSSPDEFMPATLPPAVQTMMAQGQPTGYDPKRLPSSMFRTQSTCPAQWSATSNDQLFSIQLENSGGDGPLYLVGDLYYDSAGVFHRLSSVARLPAVPGMSTGNSSRSLCVRDDCAGCSTSMNKKPVRFATTDGVAGPRSLPAALEDSEASAAETGAAAKAGRLWGRWTEGKEEAVEMVVKASELGHRTLLIDLDSGEDDKTVFHPEDKNKAKATCPSNCLKNADQMHRLKEESALSSCFPAFPGIHFHDIVAPAAGGVAGDDD
ncbi:hypothetical protein TRIUR3_21218 [Triticum urartu]|uniref:Uncharacterized protein n=1 Tax=Triticum urartu TaxID=4572 RepID=M7YH91_TRIUA|nr:hypothetical protein TRIUR3_21218 [Triticum urartu]